ncbi:MAG: hypothetical protein A3G34_11375 [Candidatus Lindowbacteria bacterium RIFCSPLOWO2_12_FULL_62_27]|nr:MAG: hypothetical protein A3I06_16355 [Candidatus Lindowbacteria bacterium RIFCSPLOWO2_02_FULL_62_12]OGH60743.1 MAG: hypothetical protein A3G34_11375 [Candidatus Lindowbacteria bacterium RIFCSPLOWO2_12_FULL_62_27]
MPAKRKGSVDKHVQDLVRALRAHECPEVTYFSGDFPVFWRKASGCFVWDVRGRRYVDMTAAFAVANLGHGHPALIAALRRQTRLMIHGMGDVHPPEIKSRFLAALAGAAPGALSQTILSQNGSDAVESAIKTAQIARPGRDALVAFSGSYHGLSYGALSVTGQRMFRAPFAGRISKKTLFVDYPYCYRCPLKLAYPGCGIACLDGAARKIRAAGGARRFSAVIVEPIQGRGGEIVPPPGWLARLARFCRRERILLIADEIYTGFARTGRMFACEHERVTPDILCLGKGMTGGFPMSACIGTPAVMRRWGRSAGEAIHTSTFLGNPLGCAMGLAALSIYIRRSLHSRAERMGSYLRAELARRLGGLRGVGDIRGQGLIAGIELVKDLRTKTPDPERCSRVVVEALRRRLMILGGGIHQNVISLSPPLVVGRREIDFCVGVLEDALTEIKIREG